MTRRLIFLVCGAALALPNSGCVDSSTYERFLCRINGGQPYRERDGLYCDLGGTPQTVPGPKAAGSGRVDPFSATFKSRVVAPGRLRGRQVTGIRHKGTLRISPRGAPKRLLRGYTRARFTSSGTIRAGGRNGLGRLQAYLWVTFPRARGAVCVRVDAQAIDLDGPAVGQAQFRSVGGTGKAARLSITGGAPLSSQDRLVRANWQVTRGKARRAPAACRKLARVR